MNIQNEVINVLKLFQDHEVKYLVAGGFAVNYYGYARMTVDLDLWIGTSGENFKRLLQALDAADFQINKIKDLNLNNLPPVDIPIGDIRIELLPELSGMSDFETAFERASILEIDDLKIPILSKKDLITSKKGSFRPKDQDDIDHLT